MSSIDSEDECNYLLSTNRTLFRIDVGWEGIPFNIITSIIICAILIFLLAAIRYRNMKTRDDVKSNSDWLHFIYDEREVNDLKVAKFKEINTIHRLAYLPQILHQYEQLIPDKYEDKVVDKTDIPFYKHVSEPEILSIERKPSFEEVHTLRLDVEFNQSTDQIINQLYSGYDIKEYDSRGEEEEAFRLKSVLFEDFSAEEEVKKERKLKKQLKDSKEQKTQLKVDLKSYLSLKTLSHYFYIRDEDIIKNKGTDAFKYLLFQKYLICFVAFLTLICLTVILPTNKQGHAEPDTKKYSQTTISNLGKGSNLLWIHSIMSILTVIVGVLIMCHFSRLTTDQINESDRKILLIQNIPESKRKTSLLIKYLIKKFPKVVIKRVNFVYDTRQLEDLTNDLLSAIEAKKYCYQYRLLYQQICEVRPYCLGHCGGFFGFCSCCPKLDGVLYYAVEKAELEKQINEEVKYCLSKPIGSAFVVFETTEMAKKVFDSFKSRKWVSIWFQSVKAMFITDHSEQSYLWKVYYGPLPQDIEWRDIVLDSNCQRVWTVLWHLTLITIFLFVSTPSAVVQIFISLTENSEKLSTYTQFTRPYLLMAITSILPSLVLAVQYQIPYNTKSSLNHALMSKSFIFLIFMVLILPALNNYTAAYLLNRVLSANGTESINLWKCLFPSANSGFFTNYILSSAFVGNTLQMLRLSELFSYIILILFKSRSVAEYQSSRLIIKFNFSFGTKYARLLLMFTIIVTYSISSPLIAPAGLIYLVIKHFVDRYNLMFCYNPAQVNYKMHSTAVLFVHIGLLCLLIQVNTNIARYEETDSFINPSTPVWFTLIICYLMVIFKCFRYLFKSIYN